MCNILKTLFFIFILPAISYSQEMPANKIAEMRWELNYQIYLTLQNDTGYSLNVSDLFHVKNKLSDNYTTEYIYYPVGLSNDYVKEVQLLNSSRDSASVKDTLNFKTLWSALHYTVGSGWVHFSNCILYALETQSLKLTAPLMKRPNTKWKPKPMTETYKRTKNWEYYAPVNQKQAIKEYKYRLENDELGDLKNIPYEFIELFLNMSEKEYEAYLSKGDNHTLAKIDMVKLLLGVNFLSKVQIKYIQSAVLNAIQHYSANQLPTVIIFDEYEAAAAMSINKKGYQINKLAFNNEVNLNEEEKDGRRQEIEQIVAKINAYNNKAFEKRLNQYYHK